MTSSSSPQLRPTLLLTDEPTVGTSTTSSLLAEAQLAASHYNQNRAATAAYWVRQGLAQFQQGRYTSALALLHQALRSYRNLSDQEREGKVLLILAGFYYRGADYLWAVDYGRQCLQVAHALADTELMQQALDHLGNSYRHLGDLQKALGYMNRSLQLAKQRDDRPGEMRSLNNLAMVYRAKGLTRQAATLYEASLLMAQSLREETVQLQILQNLGNTYQTLRAYKQAIKCYETFLALSQEGHRGGTDNNVTRRVLTQLTLASIALQDHSRAIVYLQQHLTIACALGDTRATATLIDSLKSSYTALNHSRMAALGIDSAG